MLNTRFKQVNDRDVEHFPGLADGFFESHRLAQLDYSSHIAKSLLGFRGVRVVLMEFVPHGIDSHVGRQVEYQILGQGSGTVLPALGKLLHLLAQ
jgi:hypothetical protein